MPSALTHLECSRCKKEYPFDKLINLCECGGPLLARYDLPAAKKTFTPEVIRTRAATMWRYRELLPGERRVSLGEGMTPLIHAKRLGERIGLTALYVKDEGLNPTGSFKARGLAAAVTMGKELGAKTLAIPTAGNAGDSANAS